jgi:hypothetical protein
LEGGKYVPARRGRKNGVRTQHRTLQAIVIDIIKIIDIDIIQFFFVAGQRQIASD